MALRMVLARWRGFTALAIELAVIAVSAVLAVLLLHGGRALRRVGGQGDAVDGLYWAQGVKLLRLYFKVLGLAIIGGAAFIGLLLLGTLL